LRAFDRRVASRLRRLEEAWGLRAAIDATVDPQRIADIIVAHAAARLGGTSWAIVEADASARLAALAGRGVTAALTPTVLEVASWVVRHDREFWAPDLRDDRRVVASSRVAAAAVPLRCRGQVFGALVGLDHVSAVKRPRGVEPALSALAALVESPAVALENATQRARAEALSVTDDLTQLYNSRFLNQIQEEPDGVGVRKFDLVSNQQSFQHLLDRLLGVKRENLRHNPLLAGHLGQRQVCPRPTHPLGYQFTDRSLALSGHRARAPLSVPDGPPSRPSPHNVPRKPSAQRRRPPALGDLRGPGRSWPPRSRLTPPLH